jgi:ankyrin repeat protein
MTDDIIAKITHKCKGSRNYVFDTLDNTSNDLADRITNRCKRHIDMVFSTEVDGTKVSKTINKIRHKHQRHCDSIITDVITHTLGGCLIQACENNDITSVRELLKLGAKANYVILNNDTTIFNYSSPIISASKEGHAEIALLLIQSGAYKHEYQLNTDEDYEQEGLIHACFQGHFDTARILLENGAQINLYEDEEGRTIIDHALLEGKENIVNLLLEYKVTLCDNSLHYAVLGKNINIVSMMLDRFEVDCRSSKNTMVSPLSTALMCASSSPEVVKLLLNNNADINVVNEYGENSLMIACENFGDNDNIVKSILMLFEHGATLTLEQRDKIKEYQNEYDTCFNQYMIKIYKIFENLIPVKSLVNLISKFI